MKLKHFVIVTLVMALVIGLISCSGSNDISVLVQYVPSTATPLPTTDIGASYNRRTQFVPLDTPEFIPAEEASYLIEEDLVLALEWGGESRAYPLRMLWFHHIVNDTIAGQPFLITF